MPPKPIENTALGCQIPTLDHRDRDFLKSFKLAGTAAPKFPDEYNTDAGLWMPNQNDVNPEFPNTPAQPEGCTNFTSSDVSADLDGILKDPGVIEAITHANARGGYQVRDSLLVAKKLGWITGFYNIQAYAPLDYFDAIRLAVLSGLPEKRSVSIGTPWGIFDWSDNANSPIYKQVHIVGDINNKIALTLPWHNWKIGGWVKINGVPMLKCKPWMGKDIGWLYFDRATINTLMALRYTIAFTATHSTPQTIYKIDMAVFDKFMSYLKTFIGFRY